MCIGGGAGSGGGRGGGGVTLKQMMDAMPHSQVVIYRPSAQLCAAFTFTSLFVLLRFPRVSCEDLGLSFPWPFFAA